MSLRDLVWSACAAVSPKLHLTLKSMLGAQRSRAFERRSGQIAYTEAFIRQYGPAVLAGPFKGLKFPPAAFGHNLVPKLMGVYELQLHPALEAAIGRAPAHIVNIGAAEGYYTAGLALRLPNASIHAFDAAPAERNLGKEVARENGISARVNVGGICTVEWLRDHLQPGDLVFSDCEGGEDLLCDPTQAPALRRCDLIVECHEADAPGVTQRLLTRFQGTHDITSVPRLSPARETLPKMSAWTDQDYDRALEDGRVLEQDWLIMVARDRVQ